MIQNNKVDDFNISNYFIVNSIIPKKVMEDKEVSDFSLERKECPRCKAVWLNGRHYWTGTGKPGDPETLSNLVCNNVDDPQCINPCYKKGHIYQNKDTWEKRKSFITEWNPNATE